MPIPAQTMAAPHAMNSRCDNEQSPVDEGERASGQMSEFPGLVAALSIGSDVRLRWISAIGR
jgi:hypothetical protein